MSLDAPNSEVDICNLALIKLKQELIAQIDPIDESSSVAENLCAELYQQVRRASLRAHTWNFAIERKIIAADTGNPPVFGQGTAFLKPDDWIRFVSRHNTLGQVISRDKPEIEGNQIIIRTDLGSTANTLHLRYIRDHEEVAKWDPLFIEYFSVSLALKLAPNFSSATVRVKADLKEDFRDIKAEAKAVDSQENPPRRIEHSRFRRSRRAGNSNVASPFTIFDSD